MYEDEFRISMATGEVYESLNLDADSRFLQVEMEYGPKNALCVEEFISRCHKNSEIHHASIRSDSPDSYFPSFALGERVDFNYPLSKDTDISVRELKPSG